MPNLGNRTEGEQAGKISRYRYPKRSMRRARMCARDPAAYCRDRPDQGQPSVLPESRAGRDALWTDPQGVAAVI
jgi:hypothetical protein